MLDNKQIPPLWPTWPTPPGVPTGGGVPLWASTPPPIPPQQPQAVPQQVVPQTPPVQRPVPASEASVVAQAPQAKPAVNLDLGENILKELSGDLDFGKKQTSSSKSKNSLFYIQMAISSLFWVQLALLIGILGALGYIYAQQNVSYSNTEFLNPVCSLLLWEEFSKKNMAIGNHSCSSLSGLQKTYADKTEILKDQLIEEMSTYFSEDYKLKNFGASSEIHFLTNNKISRLRVLNILNEFDRLKNEFTGKEKLKVHCVDIRITEDSVMHLKCNFVGSPWIPGIIGPKADANDRISGSTISYAMSFLNFIEKNPASRFQVIEYPITLTTDDTDRGEKETDIEFKLKYSQFSLSIDQ